MLRGDGWSLESGMWVGMERRFVGGGFGMHGLAFTLDLVHPTYEAPFDTHLRDIAIRLLKSSLSAGAYAWRWLNLP